MKKQLALILCLAQYAFPELIYPRGRHRPPFVLGRPPGGHLRTAYYHATKKLSFGDSRWPWVETHWFTQKMDHFDPHNVKTWQQKYYYNPKYYNNQSLIFLFIGGEGPESGKWAGNPEVSYMKWAAKYGAMVFDLEHRFFGDSWPIQSMDYESLKLCTTQQALADLANFITAMNKKFAFSNPKWITFGGSYPGSLSAFFRAKYPDLTIGAVASSAPVNLKLDFYEYAMVVEDGVKLTDANCGPAIQAAFSAMQQMTLSTAGRNQLNKIWNLHPPFDSQTTKLDITNFLANVYSVFQGMTQYTYDGQSEMTKRNITLRAMCNIMTNASVPDPVQRAYNIFLWYQSFYGDPNSDITIFPNSYWDMITAMSQKNVTNMDENGADRGWMWLCCNEIGFLQTTDQGRNIFGSTVPLNYFIDMCTDLFGSNVGVNFIRDNNLMAQNYYQQASEATNVVLPNGSLDPWHALGAYAMSTDNLVVPILINGTAHCADMYPAYESEPPALAAARLQIEQNLETFMNQKPAPPFASSTHTLTSTSTAVKTAPISVTTAVVSAITFQSTVSQANYSTVTMIASNTTQSPVQSSTGISNNGTAVTTPVAITTALSSVPPSAPSVSSVTAQSNTTMTITTTISSAEANHTTTMRIDDTTDSMCRITPSFVFAILVYFLLK